ncbi:GldG family protein [Vallitalea okinawensis]|uniref:GldG family protein n=1 Tax=Vallitalea okinawensis TaxID=2078660 RepID=UPI000CFCDD5E|nr:GldG family protein [Vallitalea okinawensis]
MSKENKIKSENKGSFKSKKLRYGGYSAVVSFILIAILIVVNLVVSELNLTFDLTPNSIFSISDTTETLLENNEDPITVYALYEAGGEDETIMNILKDYEKASNYINVQSIDPVLNPNFVEQYKTGPDEMIQTGSLIVVNENAPTRFRVVSPYDMYAYNQYTQQQTLDAEQAITSAIDYVIKEELPMVYVVSGHNESSLSYSLTEQLKSQNYESKEVNLLTDEIEAAEDNIIVINSPKLDLTEDETVKVTEYMEAGGRAIIFVDFNTPDMPNFNSILKRYGLAVDSGVIVEGDKSHMMGYYANILLPNLESHDITDGLAANDLNVVIPQAAAIRELDQKKSQTDVTPLLTTTKDAYLKADPNSQTVEMEEGDVPGPFNVAVAVTEDNYNDIENTTLTSKLVVVSTSAIMEDSLIASTGNLDFLINGANWLSDQEDSISILPKSEMLERLVLDQTQALLYAGFFIILLPLIVIVYGISVWLRRRHL